MNNNNTPQPTLDIIGAFYEEMKDLLNGLTIHPEEQKQLTAAHEKLRHLRDASATLWQIVESRPAAPYTLQRFYYEAKVLIEKYNYVKEDWELNVSFDIKRPRHSTQNHVEFMIRYAKENHRLNDDSIYSWGGSPQMCLDEFENKLQDLTGKQLSERVSVELPSE